MSTICCLTMPSNHHSLTSPIFLSNSDHIQNEQEKEVEMEEENYSIILNQHSPCLQQQQTQQQPLLLVAEEAEILNIENDNDKLLLPSSTRSLKRRMSLFEKSRDWVNDLFSSNDF